MLTNRQIFPPADVTMVSDTSSNITDVLVLLRSPIGEPQLLCSVRVAKPHTLEKRSNGSGDCRCDSKREGGQGLVVADGPCRQEVGLMRGIDADHGNVGVTGPCVIVNPRRVKQQQRMFDLYSEKVCWLAQAATLLAAAALV